MKDTAKTENGLGDVDIADMMIGIGARAKKASAALAIAPPEVKALALDAAADAVLRCWTDFYWMSHVFKGS